MRRLAGVLLALLPIVTGAQPQASGADFAELDRWIRRRAEADSFSGAVLVAKDGVPLLRAGYGLADRDKQVSITPETNFNLGSIDTLITRIAIWQLVAAGKLALDVPIGRYLPDYPNAQVRDKVTARQLYEMKSGVGGFYGDEHLRRHAEIRSVDAYLPLFASNPLEVEPGTSMLYSNGGYIILGKLIERLSGRSYYDYVLENITGPLGMTGTRQYLIDEARSKSSDRLHPDARRPAGEHVQSCGKRVTRWRRVFDGRRFSQARRSVARGPILSSDVR